jgi:hypothetical protein
MRFDQEDVYEICVLDAMRGCHWSRSVTCDAYLSMSLITAAGKSLSGTLNRRRLLKSLMALGLYLRAYGEVSTVRENKCMLTTICRQNDCGRDIERVR